jgi:hypothetical protein
MFIKTSESDKFTWKLFCDEAHCQVLCTVNRPSEDGYKKQSKHIGALSCICAQISEICCKICGNNIYVYIVYAVRCWCEQAAESLQ